MNTKKVIIIFFTLIYLILSSISLIFQYNQMNAEQEENASKLLQSIVTNIETNIVIENIIKNYPKDFFFAIWIKKDSGKWLPIIYDNKILSNKNLFEPNAVPDIIKINTKIFQKKIKNYETNIWINKFNTDFYTNYIFIFSLFLLLVYFCILFIIFLFFKNNAAYAGNYSGNYYEQKISSNDLDEYKELWHKDFKTTDDFKNDFPFKEIFNLIKIGISPEQFIKESLDIATDYFKWKNPKFYIIQKESFIDIKTKETLDPSIIMIPQKGNQKGKIFLPVYPYNIDKLYGYLCFEWEKDDNFHISDILYFLKFLFSEESKFIFINYTDIETIITVLNRKLEKHDQIFLAVMKVDDKYQIMKRINETDIDKLNNKILNKINEGFVNELIYPIYGFTYIIIGINFDKEKKLEDIKNWIKNENNQHYHLSNSFGDLALTFSCGISFKDNRELHPLAFLNEAEKNLNNAQSAGGNQLK